MTTLNMVAAQARSLLSGTLGTETAILAEDYAANSGVLVLKNTRRVPPGSQISVGMTTFLVLESDETSVTVRASYDGSPDEDYPVNSAVFLRPLVTGWQMFTEISGTIRELSAPANGLYRIVSEVKPVDTVNGTYGLGRVPLKVMRVRALQPGSGSDWKELPFAVQAWAEGGPRVVCRGAPGGSQVQIVYAADFDVPTSLDDDLGDLGMSDTWGPLLAVGAARNLSLGQESRRNQPFSQGDPRRAEDVPITGNLYVYDRLQRRFRDLVTAERTKLVALHPDRRFLGVGT